MTQAQGFSFTVGQVVGAAAARYEAKRTRAPERYTDESLIDAMLHADRFAQNESDRVVLRETEGLGTARTRDKTIEGLIQKGYLTMTRRGKRNELESTQALRELCAHLPDYLKDVATTAKWEIAFSLIEKGRATPEQVRLKIEELVLGVIESAKASRPLLSGLGANVGRQHKDS